MLEKNVLGQEDMKLNCNLVCILFRPEKTISRSFSFERERKDNRKTWPIFALKRQQVYAAVKWSSFVIVDHAHALYLFKDRCRLYHKLTFLSNIVVKRVPNENGLSESLRQMCRNFSTFWRPRLSALGLPLAKFGFVSGLNLQQNLETKTF